MHGIRAMKPIIQADAVTVIRDEQEVLKNVSLVVSHEDFITIIGPNGAGKSTLLKCLMGFFKPDKGQVIRHEPLRIGYVPQRLSADQSMPITARRFLKLGKPVEQDELEQIAAETDISHVLATPLYALSGGELQRVLLARALLDKPRLLILDEPAQNLDVSGQLRFYHLIEQVHQQRRLAILMVSHDLHLVMSSTQKVVCLFHHVCCSGEPQVVARDPEFISLFGDEMAKMMSVYHHSHDHEHRGRHHD